MRKFIFLSIISTLIACDDSDSDNNVITENFTLREGYQLELFAEGLDLPTSLAFSPDGRLFVNELQTGNVLIYENGELLSSPFVTIETNVSGGFPVEGENGLIGIAFDPDFSSNGFVYFTYVLRDVSSTYGRVVRFTADGNLGSDETVLLDEIPVAPGHQIESLTFGPDGKLYVSVGDAFEDSLVQDPTTVLGKILRINRDGSVPEDNPFPGTMTYALGFRNNFDLVFRSNGDLLTTENGPDEDDELNVVIAGGNYGWPFETGLNEGSEFINPSFVWEQVVSPTGMLIYAGDQFPPEVQGNLIQVLFGDTFSQGSSQRAPDGKRIMIGTLSGSGINTTVTFEELVSYTSSGIGNPLDIAEGPDGSLYFTDIFQGRIYQITYQGD